MAEYTTYSHNHQKTRKITEQLRNHLLNNKMPEIINKRLTLVRCKNQKIVRMKREWIQLMNEWRATKLKSHEEIDAFLKTHNLDGVAQFKNKNDFKRGILKLIQLESQVEREELTIREGWIDPMNAFIRSLEEKECQICYTGYLKRPRVNLPCSHQLCTTCYNRLQSEKENQLFCCPFCKEKIHDDGQ